jgi:hypothetical protein
MHTHIVGNNTSLFVVYEQSTRTVKQSFTVEHMRVHVVINGWQYTASIK